MAKLKGSKKPKNKNQLLLANEALYGSSADKKDWMNEIYIPKDPGKGENVWTEDALPGGDKQLGFTWLELVKQLQINKNKKLANAPRLIKGGTVPNAIIKAPHIDSPYIDKLLMKRKQNKGVQLFPIKPL